MFECLPRSIAWTDPDAHHSSRIDQFARANYLHRGAFDLFDTLGSEVQFSDTAEAAILCPFRFPFKTYLVHAFWKRSNNPYAGFVPWRARKT